VKRIPLDSIFSTSRQKGLRLVDQGRGDEGFEFQIRELQQNAINTGASNIFLVRGDDIRSAVRATRDVFCGGRAVDEAVNSDPESKPRDYWLVAYLGVAGSDPPAWVVKSVEVKSKEIRLSYEVAVSVTDDEFAYFVWVPLGELMPGQYKVELFDEKMAESILLRRVLVKAI
jgi:hypothetical protein